MGRLTRPFASRYDELVQRLRREVGEKLSSSEKRGALERLIVASNAELAAMNYGVNEAAGLVPASGRDR
jgi:hypothetical protein